MAAASQFPASSERPVVLTADEAREGVTGHGVRYVLGFSLLGVVVAFAILLLTGV
jgi:hypothetical protein